MIFYSQNLNSEQKMDSHSYQVFDSWCADDIIIGCESIRKIHFKIHLDNNTMECMNIKIPMCPSNIFENAMCLCDVLSLFIKITLIYIPKQSKWQITYQCPFSILCQNNCICDFKPQSIIFGASSELMVIGQFPQRISS